MTPKQKVFITAGLILSLILVGMTTRAYAQEKEPLYNPSDVHRLKKRPARYPAALAGLEVIADLSVDSIRHNGSCPAVFEFKGKITVNRPTVVQYRFIRSDNTRANLGVLNFEKSGVQEIADTWTFDNPDQLPNFKGWEAIQVNFPMKVRSNLVYIEGTCADYKGGPPTPDAAKKLNPETGPAKLDWPQPDPLLPPVKR